MEKELFELLLKRLIDFSIVPEGQIKFIYAETEGTLHETLILNSLLTKPSWEMFLTEESKYNNELAMAAEAAAIAEAARLAEEERVASWTARIAALEYFRETMTSLENFESNPAMTVKEIINGKDEAVLILYEEAHIPIKIKNDKRKARQVKIDVGRKVNNICYDVLDYITGHNVVEGVDGLAVDQMQIDLEEIEKWLRKSRPDKVLPLIQAMDNPLYNDLKAEVLEIYADSNK